MKTNVLNVLKTIFYLKINVFSNVQIFTMVLNKNAESVQIIVQIAIHKIVNFVLTIFRFIKEFA